MQLFQRNVSLRSRVYGSPLGVSIEVVMSEKGHSQPSLPGSSASDVRYAPNSDQRIAAPRLGAMGPLAAIGASHRLREAASVGGLFIFKGSVV
jgi:hypothetical protein